MEKKYIPHSYAVEIETILRKKGFALEQDADEIEKAPIGFISSALLCKAGEEAYTIFFNRHEEHQEKSLYELGEKNAKKLVAEVKELFND